MNVIVFASRKGGSGKSTLTAHLAAQAHRPSRPVLLIDSDPQGSLTLWHKLRGSGEPPLRNATEGVADLIKAARRAGLRMGVHRYAAQHVRGRDRRDPLRHSGHHPGAPDGF